MAEKTTTTAKAAKSQAGKGEPAKAEKPKKRAKKERTPLEPLGAKGRCHLCGEGPTELVDYVVAWAGVEGRRVTRPAHLCSSDRETKERSWREREEWWSSLPKGPAPYVPEPRPSKQSKK